MGNQVGCMTAFLMFSGLSGCFLVVNRVAPEPGHIPDFRQLCEEERLFKESIWMRSDY